MRAAFAELADHWISTLTAAQRAGWATYSANVLLPDAFGVPRDVGALPMYQRSNVSRIQAGLARVDAPPTTFDLGTFTPVVPTFAAPANLAIAFTNTDAWATEDGSALLVYSSRPQNPTVNYHRGPYRLSGTIDGDAITAPTSPAAMTPAFAAAAGQKVFLLVRASRADGRLSSPLYLDTIAV